MSTQLIDTYNSIKCSTNNIKNIFEELFLNLKMKSIQCLVVLGCLATFGLTTPSGKKLLSFPTLVSILKAKNATRPLSAPSPTVEKVPSQPQIPGLAPDMPPMAIMVPPLPASVAASLETAQLESPPSFTASKNSNICAPISKETNDQITKLCDTNGRKGANMHRDDESFNVSRGNSCLKRFCVTIIPAEDDSEVDDLDSALRSSEIAVYTECEAVKNLFHVLVKSAVTPKCFDCSK